MRSHNTRFRLQTVDAGYWRQFALRSLDFLFVCLSSIVSTVKRLQVQGFFSLFCCFFPTLILFHSLTHITPVPQSNFKQHDALLCILYSVQCTATAVAPATTATHKICVVCVWIWKYVNIYTHKQNIKMWNIHFFFIYMLIDSLDGTKSFALHSWMARRCFVWMTQFRNDIDDIYPKFIPCNLSIVIDYYVIREKKNGENIRIDIWGQQKWTEIWIALLLYTRYDMIDSQIIWNWFVYFQISS